MISLLLAYGLSKDAFFITTPDASLVISLTFFGVVFYLLTVGAVSYERLWTSSPTVPCGSTKEANAISRRTTPGRSWKLLSTLWKIMKRPAVPAIPRSEDSVRWILASVYSSPPPPSKIWGYWRVPQDDYSSQEPTLETQQNPSLPFESLKHTLSYSGGRESLYLLPSQEALAVIDILEQVSSEQFPCGVAE